jgi:hypothetical protein
MAAQSRLMKVYPVQIGYFIEKLRAIAYNLPKFTYSYEHPIPGGVLVVLDHSMSFSSWGEEIKVTLLNGGPQTTVDICSECSMPTQIIDWGKNTENLNMIFNYLEYGMQAAQGFGNQPSQFNNPQQYNLQPQNQIPVNTQSFSTPAYVNTQAPVNASSYVSPQQTPVNSSVSNNTPVTVPTDTSPQINQEIKFCTKCGRSIDPTSSFCCYCGNPQ